MATKAATHAADGKSTLPIGLSFQLYRTTLARSSVADIRHLPSKPSQLQSLDLAVEIHNGTCPVWAKADQASVEIVKEHRQASFGLATVQRGFSTKLALIACCEELLLNGTPALPFSVLEPKDSVFSSRTGTLLYVTELFRPYAGSPDEQSGLIGQVCPCCSIEIQPEPPTHVVTCRCGTVYHHETEKTHQNLEPKERLNCLKNAKYCLRCTKELSIEARLVWDPATL